MTLSLARVSTVAHIAHRGSSGVAPENTIAAVEVAIRQGAQSIENDIQRTKDGVLVVLHDPTLTRTTDVEQVFPDRASYAVADFTLGEIRQLDAGSWFAPEYAGERVPTLREWVSAVGEDAGMLLEVKLPGLYPGIEQDLDKELRSLPAFGWALARGAVLVQSFDHGWLRAYADLAPEVPVGLLYDTCPSDAELVAASRWAAQVNPAFGVTSESDVARIHELGMRTHVWTVDRGLDMRRAIRWGVDGIITNYPQVLEGILRG